MDVEKGLMCGGRADAALVSNAMHNYFYPQEALGLSVATEINPVFLSP
jgi:hypothetical protein